MSQQDDAPQGTGEAVPFPVETVSQRLLPGDSALTERAEIAARVLPALIADKELRKVFCDDAQELGTSHYDQAAYHALRHTDALIAALRQPAPPPGAAHKAPASAARPPAWDAPRTAPAQAAIEPGQSVPLSDKMVATLTLMMSGEAKPVAAAQAKFFERHGLAVAALGMPAPRRPYRNMEITALGREALRRARTGGAA